MNQANRSMTTIALNLFIVGFCIAVLPASADVTLPHIIDSNMVLQRDKPLPIWGWAEPGEQVRVKIAQNKVSIRADAQGKWMVKLPAMKAGGPYRMTVSGRNTIYLTNILVGEVWVCSGQSNMELGIGLANNAEQEIATADYPKIRLFHIPRRPSGQPAPDIDATWRVCSPNSVSLGSWGGFSAVAYFFGRQLHNQLNIPVGLIDTSWGGSRIDPWTHPAGFEQLPKLQDIAAKVEQANIDYRKTVEESLDPIETWLQATQKALEADRPVPLSPAWPQHLLNRHDRPTGLYNGMIHPLVPFAIRGAIWYQGESEAMKNDGMLYHEKMKALINGWRKVWGQGELPFYFVQIAPCKYYSHYPHGPFALPKIWEAQTATLSLPNTGMAVTTDIGDVNDIHPPNKQDVGKRLALIALAKAYDKQDFVYSGPLYQSISIEGHKVRIYFDHVGSGLGSRDGNALTWFEITGKDGEFVKANAVIDMNTVVVSNPNVPNPVAVRFAWYEQAIPNLVNKEGLPASPFRTD